MKILTLGGKPEDMKVASLVLFCKQKGFSGDPVLKKVDHVLGGAVKMAFESEEFTGECNQTLILHASGRLAAGRVVLVGLGEARAVTADSYRQAAGTVSRLSAIKKSPGTAIFLGRGENEIMAQAAVEGFLLGRFEMTDHKSDSAKKEIAETLYLAIPDKAKVARFTKAAARAQIIAEGVLLARRLAAHPGNVITPRTFAEEAVSQARQYRLRCTVLDEKKIEAEKMGALLAVGKGSEQPPRFVILEYNGSRAKGKPVVLIGKGITFDSGGISLKPAAEMDEMKGDMTGGAVVLATIITASRLKLPGHIVVLIPLAENMPSGRALKPGDIIKSRKGKTIEIISTDAEGRLILADALDYANQFKPQAVIDIATLTGAALYVLGYAGAPILGNNRALMDRIRAASKATAEKVWEMPLWDEFRELIKSSIADIKNSGGRPAGTITATAFLEKFIGDWPWAHIDIAYVDLEKNGQPYVPKGASGFGVRLLVELLASWKKP